MDVVVPFQHTKLTPEPTFSPPFGFSHARSPAESKSPFVSVREITVRPCPVSNRNMPFQDQLPRTAFRKPFPDGVGSSHCQERTALCLLSRPESPLSSEGSTMFIGRRGFIVLVLSSFSIQSVALLSV
jgi:hypothetical protein